MGSVRLPHGPWKSLLAGKYEGRDVSIYQNPQRDILYVVVDRDEGGRAKGLVVTVYRGFYLERGDLKQLLAGISGNPVGVAKKWKGELFQFLLIPAGIKYIGLDPEELKKAVDEMVVTLDRMEKNVLLLAKTLGMALRPLSLTPRNVVAMLFVEPTVIAGLAPTKPSSTEGGVLILGFSKQGEVIRESPENLRRTVIYGNEVGRKRFFKVLLEEFLRNGVNAIVATSNPEPYRGLSRAVEKRPEHSKLGLEPLGFSVEELEPLIDLATVDHDAAVDVFGVKVDTETGTKMKELLSLFAPEARRPRDVAAKITDTDLLSLRAGRVFSAVDASKGEMFDRREYSGFSSVASTGLGSAFIHPTTDPWSVLALQSLLEGIGRALKRSGKTESVRVVLFVEDAHRIFTRDQNPLTAALLKTLEAYKDFGLGWVLETEKDVLLSDVLLALSEARAGAIGENDVGVRTLVRRPYRLEPRPFLTAIG